VKKILLCISILAFCFLLLIGAYLYIRRIPTDCDRMEFRMACMELSADGLPQWQGDIRNTVYTKNNAYGAIANGDAYIRRTIGILRSQLKQKTDKIPHDVQLAEFSFGNQQEEKEVYRIAYDFSEDVLYFYENNTWYQTKERNALNKLIVEQIDACAIYPLDLRWRGQSTYANEEFVETDWENASFRYELYWKPSINEEKRKDASYQDSNFRNTAPTDIQNANDAVALAANELQFQTPVGFVFHDEISGYWMVELYDEQGILMSPSNESGDFLREHVYTVIMDGNGITKEVYRGVTRYTAFWDN